MAAGEFEEQESLLRSASRATDDVLVVVALLEPEFLR